MSKEQLASFNYPNVCNSLQKRILELQETVLSWDCDGPRIGSSRKDVKKNIAMVRGFLDTLEIMMEIDERV